MRKLEISRDAEKALTALQAKQFKQLGSAIFKLLTDPEPHDSLVLKGGKRGERRVDVGEYRIVYSVTEDCVQVLVIGKRNDMRSSQSALDKNIFQTPH